MKLKLAQCLEVAPIGVIKDIILAFRNENWDSFWEAIDGGTAWDIFMNKILAFLDFVCL